MGGRGSSGSGNNFYGLRVKTSDGFKAEYFFSTANGKNYYQTGISGKPQVMPNNMTKNEFRKRMIKNGATVSEISSREKAKMESEYKKDREETGKMLSAHDVQDKVMKRVTRMNRIANRRRR